MTSIGLGVDAHGLDPSRTLVLGGVSIPGSPGLAGHSDADVLCHAIADAVLGAARLADLGTMFPDDERWRDASSLDILTATGTAVRDAGWSISSVDATVLAEAPKLAAYRPQMIAAIASALDVERDTVWIKATTTDGLGFVGRGEGIAALAVALVERHYR
jgi:2-C-methyl-D-erythritol 2,4-cyclodiphosphate synthase